MSSNVENVVNATAYLNKPQQQQVMDALASPSNVSAAVAKWAPEHQAAVLNAISRSMKQKVAELAALEGLESYVSPRSSFRKSAMAAMNTSGGGNIFGASAYGGSLNRSMYPTNRTTGSRNQNWGTRSPSAAPVETVPEVTEYATPAPGGYRYGHGFAW